MIYVVDIDGTICTNTDGDPENAIPYPERIAFLNDLFDQGHQIIYFTARGMKINDDNPLKAYECRYELTKNQFHSWGVKFTRLVIGKPYGDIYIDDKGINDQDFFKDIKINDHKA
jgi:hypothetical protein